jgi:homoserine O-succinyltransferase/O-acetyltransferase
MRRMRSGDPVSGQNWCRLSSRDENDRQAHQLRIALVNNMPDAALEDTENQFLDLLATAAGGTSVWVEFYSLPEIARGERALQHMGGLYSNFRDLPHHRFDALIITGTEPRHPDLRKEVYWERLIGLLDWAECNTASTILSCLAAHASVLHSDSVERRLLRDKKFGVFDEEKASDHLLMAGAPEVIRIPHSRWNELREEDLVSSGYTVLTKSRESGVGLFTKQKGRSLFVHVQGHPEYATETLLKEYRRDVRRFLRGERETYPSMPYQYFSASAVEVLADFQEKAASDRSEAMLAAFPDAVIAQTLRNGWHRTGASLYRNWLHYLSKRAAESTKCSVMITSHGQIRRNAPAVRQAEEGREEER